MLLKIAGILYILYIIAVFLIVVIFESKRFIKCLQDKEMRKMAVLDLVMLIFSLPIIPFTILLRFLEDEYNLYL